MACATVLAGLAAGLLAACATPFRPGGSDLPGDRNLGALRVGSYNYVAACLAFRQEDYTSIAGPERPDWNVQSTFATRTYGDQDPYRVYLSQCRHDGLSVEIAQFPTAEQLLRGLNGVQGGHDTAVSNALGLGRDQVFSDPDSGTITVKVYNKVVSTQSLRKVQDVSGGAIQRATMLMKVVLRRLRDLAAHPAGPMDVTRPGASVAGRPYLASCGVLRPADYAQVLGTPADEGLIEADYPVADIPPTTRFVKQENVCRIGSLPDKTSRQGSVQEAMHAFDAVTTYAQVTVSQLSTPADAASVFKGNRGTPVPGLGDQAVYVDLVNGAGVRVRYLTLRKGTNLAEFRVTHDKVGSSIPEGLDVLSRLAALCVPRMG
jgi:hypothetical protein